MRSFSDFRKNQLKKDIYAVSVREGVNRHFDMLKMDLFEASALPPMLFENNFPLRSAYDFNRKLDHEEVKDLIEVLIGECKNNFYDYLVNEEAAAATEFSSLHTDLIAKIKQMVAELKAAVGNVLGTVRSPEETGGVPGEETGDTPGADPSAGPTVPGGSAPAAKTSGGTPASHAPASPSGTPGIGSPPPKSMHTPPSVTPAPTNPSSPAAYGSMRPSDGFLKGAGRLASSAWGGLKNAFKKITRPIRRIWHNDPTRENMELLLPIFNENAEGISKLIDKFGDDLVQYVGDRIGTIAGTVAANGGLSPDVGSKPKSASNVAPIDAGPTAGTDPKVIDPEKESPVERMAAGGDPQAQQAVETHWDFFHHGLRALGMDSKYNRNWGGEKIKKKKLVIDGKQVTTETASAIAREVYQRIFTKIMKMPETSPWLTKKSLSKRLVKAVQQYVGGLKVESPNKLDGLLELILKLGKKIKTGAGATGVAPQPNAPAAPQATTPKDMNTPPVNPVDGERNLAMPPAAKPQTPRNVAPIDAGPRQSSEGSNEQAARFMIDHKDLIEKILALHKGSGLTREKLTQKVAEAISQKGAGWAEKQLTSMLGDQASEAPAGVEPEQAEAPADGGVSAVRYMIGQLKDIPDYEDITNDTFNDDEIKAAFAKSGGDAFTALQSLIAGLEDETSETTPEATPEATPETAPEVPQNKGAVETPEVPGETDAAQDSIDANMEALLNSKDYMNLKKELSAQAEEKLSTKDQMIAFRKAIHIAAEKAIDAGGDVNAALDAAQIAAADFLLDAEEKEKAMGEHKVVTNLFQNKLNEYKTNLKNVSKVTESKYQNLRKRIFATN